MRAGGTGTSAIAIFGCSRSSVCGKGDAKDGRRLLAGVLRSFGQSLREYALQEKAERAVSSRSAEQQARIRAFVRAGDVRLAATESLAGERQVPAALVLYREGIVFIIRALLEARGKESSDQPAAEAFRSLALLVESGELPEAPPDGFDDARALLTDTRPLAYDELPAALALSRRAQVEAMALWLRGLVDARAPRQIKVSRALRIGTIALVGLGIGFGVSKLASSKNIALGKSVQLSSQRPECPAGSGEAGLPPSGLVDGTVSAGYDICTKAEARPWAKLDLEQVRRIGTVVVHNRADCCWGNYDLPVVLELSDDGTNFREVARRTTAYTAADPWVIDLDDQSARFVKLRIDSNETRELVLTELEIYAP